MQQAFNIDFKKRLHQYCVQMIEDRIATTLAAMNNAQAAANSEEKSSAGDKYETGRAMGHLEKEMHGKQLAANRRELAALMAVDCNTIHNAITTGSFIRCNTGSFFVAAGLGKISFEGETIFVLSPVAPVAGMLHNKKAGESFIFNNHSITITGLY
jgi:hypothetical protein